MRATFKLLIAPVLVSFLSGCASLLSEDVQELRVTLLCKQRPVAVSCTATNNLGRWQFSSPGTVLVLSDNSLLDITCRGNSTPRFTVVVPPVPSWTMAGTLLAGGLVGAAVDAYTGVGLKYPENIDINNPACD
jgi:hypothetical protein